MATARMVYRDFPTDGIPGEPWEPDKAEIRELLTGYEETMADLEASRNSGVMGFATRSSLYAWTTAPTILPALAHVLADTTAANNGVYRNTAGGTGSANWTKIAELPDEVIKATDAGAGTANAIVVAVRRLPTDGDTMFFRVFATTTDDDVTVAVTGGSTYAIRTATGAKPLAGTISAGMLVFGQIDATNGLLRLGVDTDTAAAQAAAAASAQLAKDYANKAEDVEVEPGYFSGFHYAAKVSYHVIQAEYWAGIAMNAAAVSDLGNYYPKSEIDTLLDQPVPATRLQYGDWTNVASAATVNLGAQSSRNIVVTGNIGITSFGTAGPADNVPYLIRFSGTPPLTHGANLILPGRADITAAVGDVMEVVHDDADTWRVIRYDRATTAPSLSQTTWNEGTSPVRAAISPTELKAAIAASTPDEYESDEIAITPSSSVTLTHSLGVASKIIGLYLVCKTSDRGYAVGDSLIISSTATYIGSYDVSGVVATIVGTTNIVVTFCNYLPILPPKTGGSGAHIVASSWRLVVRARK